ncbi:MAG: sugar ABC transporter ATP-binding protein [Bacteroidales bacterium]|nr:sugar ABC transporter ATP-binding protein [Bacteroidales bacterium]
MHRVELLNISKSYGGISALKNVSLRVKPGEIHALIGENGAGKSTLMKILSGAISKDAGKVHIDGHEALIRSTHDSKKLGIGIIYQEFSLVPDLSVAENIFLSQLVSQGFWMKWAKLKSKAEELINSIGFDIDPVTLVHKLSIAQQQIVEIAKALSEKVSVLILDEPSAVLGTHEIHRLFDTLKRLSEEGVSIIYITHHLEEVFEIADQVTVLKDGSSVDCLNVSNTGKDELVRLMLGRSLDAMFPDRQAVKGQELMKVENIVPEGKDCGVSLSVNAGEVLGIAGLVGSGRTELLRAIYAADKPRQGEIFISGKRQRIKIPYEAVRAGIGMVPEDRKQHGAILSLSVKQNISLTNMKGITDKLGFIHPGKEKDIVGRLLSRLSVKASSENAIVSTLSGGNQQKTVLAKWINRRCSVLMIDEPTRGVDVGAKAEIYNLVNELSLQGMGLILVSSETEELMGICDRILVMRNGEIQGELLKEDFTEENILRLAIGA